MTNVLTTGYSQKAMQRNMNEKLGSLPSLQIREMLRHDLLTYFTPNPGWDPKDIKWFDGCGPQLAARMGLQKYLSGSDIIVFDVGCNIAPPLDDFTGLVLHHFPDCKVHGFEPVHWEEYKETYKQDERVDLHKIALSENDCLKKIYSPSASGLSSFHFRKSWQRWEEEDQQQIQEKRVECRSIDSFSEEMRINHIDYLKLDCEGAEFEVLLGASRLISQRRIYLIQVEDQTGFCEDAGFDSQTSISLFLEQNGYEPVVYDGQDFVWRLK